ncbi:MAG TPA: cbb3-type cytochrome c oxidase subunit I [Magnetospirillum sp.]|nr:cbb3-type cytochrome c oxidase subunit I [Magnetospirillum sp.]
MQIANDNRALDRAARAEVRGWLLLAVGALAVAGALALALALARTPGIQDRLPWGPEFFHRGLVTHVVFSFQVWLLAMVGALGAAASPSATRPLGYVGLALAVAGSALLLVPTLAGWGDASLNNYVPVLVHPTFYAGLAVLAAGVALASARALWPGAGVGPRAIALCLWSALGCFGLAAARIPADTPIELLNERLFWGGGHVLQFLNTALLMLGWQKLSRRAWGVEALPPSLTAAAFAGLAAAALVAPVAYGLDVLGLAHRQAFTSLLWFGLPLSPLVMGTAVAWRLWRGPRDWRSPAVLALAGSLAVFGLGGLAGFGLGVADTRTPSHYHAVIGGVNLVLMGLVHVEMLPSLRRSCPIGGWVRAQFLLYGGGQMLHALGFYVAGLAGVARKTAGSEQGLDSALKLAAMGMVGLGGAIAVLGGVMFVVQVLGRLLRREASLG